MKVSISYPPINTDKGVPLLSQNRQFQYFNNHCYIYPVVPALAVTMLKRASHQVFWHDGIAKRWDIKKYFTELKRTKPDIIAIESKTPTIKYYWQVINRIKELLPKSKVVLMGDHVTALPAESFRNSKVDYVLTGGDFDFLLLNLVNHLDRQTKIEPGIYYRDKASRQIKSTGKFQANHDLKQLPKIDRDLSEWRLYAYDNGNFKYKPGTYTMIGRDCWWRADGGCTFCSWTSTFPNWRVGTPQQLLDEIGELIDKYQVKEIFDDTGTFPIGPWLKEFCQGMIERDYNKKIKFSCNMRAKALNQAEYNLMAKAGFRFILYGLESGNQETLDLLNKGTKVSDIKIAARMAKKAGLMPHLTVMMGYPWETLDEAKKTVALAKEIMDHGWADSLQATIVIPYPGTRLFKECEANDWLTTKDWKDYDMRQPVMKSPIPLKEINELTRKLYKLSFSPGFLYHQISSIRSWADIKYLARAGKAVFGHLADFFS